VSSFGLPAEPVFIILGIDALMDMARTATNVLGNCLATVVIARWEGEAGMVSLTSEPNARELTGR
jgi:proton glutamate symport protein